MFNLEKSIAAWKKSLKKQERLEDGLIADLELHFRDVLESRKNEGFSEEEAFRSAEAQVGTAEAIAAEYQKNQILALDRRSPWRFTRFMPALLGNYFKVAGRKLKRQKSHSLINIGGLSVGMACFLLIMTFIQFETSFDRFHEKSGKLFRVAVRGGAPADTEYSLSTPEILSQALMKKTPEIERAGIVQRSRNAVLQTEKNRFRESGLFADANFFHLFSFEILRGDRAKALAAPNSIVLSDFLAKKLFGDEDPVGKNLKYTGSFLACDLNVTGVVKRPPQNTHLQFEYLISVATMAANKDLAEWFNDWDVSAFLTYVELKGKPSPRAAEQKIEAVFREGGGDKEPRKETVFLQPITDIHLKSRVAGETATNNRIQSVYLLGSIAFFILLVAGINSMNLSTARASTRAKEIGIRKVVGGSRAQLIRQFIGESYLFAGLAMVLALMMFFAFFPIFTNFLGTGLTLAEVDLFPLALAVLSTFLFIGAFSGIYPAVVLSGFQPFSLFNKHSTTRQKGVGVRNLLVIVQFSAAVVLLIGTLVIAKQIGYIQKMNPGFERENVVMLTFDNEETPGLAKVLKSRFEAYHKVRGVTVSDSSPLALSMFLGGSSVQREDGGTVKIDYHLAHVDDDFLRVYGIKIAEGRNFSPQFPGDADGILVNQALVRKIGWTNPIGKKLMKSSVIGVVEDFHFTTLHKEIEPAAFSRKEAFMGKTYLGIKIQPDDPEGALAEIKAIGAQAAAGRILDFYFLDDAFNGQYRRERRLAAMVGYLEGVAILLGCMGLFGLATYAAQRRAKEIGIRKVLGATVFRIIRMMSGEFLVLMFIANAIAWPAGQYFMRKWLQEYAYHCSLGIEVFVLAGLGTMLLALFVVGLQTVKASLSNPLESIRYD